MWPSPCHVSSEALPSCLRSSLAHSTGVAGSPVVPITRMSVEPLYSTGAGVRTFFSEWKFRKAGTSDLLASMEQASGRDLSEFFEAWIFGAVIPEARFTYQSDARKVVLRLEQFGPPIEFPVTVRLKFQSGREQDVVLVASGKVTEQVIDLKERLRSAEANPDHGSLVELR